MRSLRRTLILGTIAGTTLVLAAAGALLYLYVRAALVNRLDHSLLETASLLASTADQTRDRVDLDFEELEMREFGAKEPSGYLEAWAEDGSVLFRSASLGRDDLERVAGPLDSPAFRWLTLRDGRPGRAIGITFSPRVERKREGEQGEAQPDSPGDWPPRNVTLVLARDTSEIEAMLGRLRTLLAVVGIVAVAVSAGVLWSVIGRCLRPLDHLAAQIGRLGEEDLSTRVEMRPPLRELQPVADRLNGLLDRLEHAFQRERAFSADVAHELRTPLAGLRSTLEVTLSRPRRSAQYQEALSDSLLITRKMEDMVGGLLALARLEAGQVAPKAEPVALDKLIRAAWTPLAGAAEARRLRVEWALDSQAPVTTDPALLGQAIRNVLENTVDYADEGGWVKIEAGGGERGAEIRVANSGSALPRDQAEQAFERFWRGDASRTSTGDHCGLGLALVKKIVAILGGSVRARSTVGGDFELRISLPPQPPVPPKRTL